jgi:hypothetical protein
MELVRRFNVDLDATETISNANSYVDKVIQRRSNSYINLENLSSRELASMYKQLVSILSNEYKRLVGEPQD